jgi:drug/metabolite transporter (DMT)-like permease
MAVLLALVTAASYGVGDFCGGLAARRAAPLTVTATAHALGLVGVTILAAVVGAELVRPADLALGAAGGVCGCLGVVLLYRGLATGRMAVVSPISAVVAAVVPVVGGLVAGERPGPLAVIGIVAALVAIALVSRTGPMGRPDPASVLVALGSGIGVGAFILLISHVHAEAGLWPLAVGRLTSVLVAGSFALARGMHPIVPRVALSLAFAAGALDVTANVTFLLATQRGLVSVVAVIASLYPAGTVLLAMAVEGERLSAPQGVGLAAAAAALVLIAV